MERNLDKFKFLTVKEKVGFLSGKNAWESFGVPHLRIPCIKMSDGPHGLRTIEKCDSLMDNQVSIPATCFPALGTLSCSFNRELAKKMGIALAEEALHNGVSILLGPGINIKRNPLCGRNFEYLSEDPYLTGELATQYVIGVQSKNVGVCLKHYAVNSQETFRYTTSSLVDERALHEIYLEAFRKVILNAHPDSIMAAYNKVNGEYACESKYLLQNILVDQYGFDGLVISDWGATNDRILGLNNGLDIEMPSSHGNNDLKVLKAIEDGSLSETFVNEKVRKIISYIDKYQKNKVIDIDNDKHNELAYEIAKESCVLLKNEGILPLKKDDSVVVIGELARTPHIQGGGSSRVNPTSVLTPLGELKKINPDIEFHPGYSLTDEVDAKKFNEALQATNGEKKVLLFLGLTDAGEEESVDRSSLSLNKNQLDLLSAIYERNKDIIIVLQGGSVIDLSFIDKCKGLLHSLLMGQMGAKAVVELLYGKANPCGKLAETIPLKYEDVPSSKFYPGGVDNSYYMESIYVGYRYYDTYNKQVRFPFGFGLSYSKFEVKPKELKQDKNKISISIDVSNVGEYKGKETVQVYIRNKSRKDFYAFQELKGFEKVLLKKDETKNIVINIPISEFKYFDTTTHRFEVENGSYDVAVGTSSRDIVKIFPVYIDSGKTKSMIENIRSCYYMHTEFNKIDYYKLLNLESSHLPNEEEVRKANTYTINSTLYELKKTFLGKIIYHFAKSATKKQGMFSKEGQEKMLDSLSLRFMMMGVNMSSTQLDGLVDIFNHKTFKGLKKLITRKEKNLNGKA